VFGAIGPLAVIGVLLIAAPRLAGRRSEQALVSGGLIGVAAAVVLSVLLGLWTLRVLRRTTGSAFLGPVAIGFLTKLAVLAGGALLLYGPLQTLGSFEAYALCFVAAVFSYQLLFLPVLEKAVRREREARQPGDGESA